MLPDERELGIGFVAYSPFGRGFLTGAVKPAAENEETDMGVSIRAGSRAISRRTLTLSSISRRWPNPGGAPWRSWLLAGFSPRARTSCRSRERGALNGWRNAGAADIRLTADDLDQIRRVLPEGAFGARYAGDMVPSWV